MAKMANKKPNKKLKGRSDGEQFPRLLTVSQVAEMLSVHINTVRIWSDSGMLTAYRIGRRRDRRFLWEDIQKFLLHGAITQTPGESPLPAQRSGSK